jgi:hypothetical protein
MARSSCATTAAGDRAHEAQIRDNLMFTADKVGETMRVALDAKDGKEWFGVPPPDLSVIARSRGADWLYTYLRTFYRDPRRPRLEQRGFPERRDAALCSGRCRASGTRDLSAYRQVGQCRRVQVDADCAGAQNTFSTTPRCATW